MRLSHLCSSLPALALFLGTTSLLAAPADPPPPPPPPAPLEASGKQPDPPSAEVAAPQVPEAQQPVTVPMAKPKVLEVPAYSPPPPPQPPPADDDDDVLAKGDHIEFTMGFLAGQRSYSKTSFTFDGGTAEGIGGGGLVKPFTRVPFDKATVLGLRYDARLVMSFIRMTVGFDLPFPTYKVSDSTMTEDINGTMRQVSVQSLSAKELRFGIGAEYQFKKVALFADLIGGVHWVNSELAIDGFKADYSATSFAFSGRGGIRGYVRKWFFASATGEVGLIGDLVWNAELSVGFAGNFDR